MSAAKRYTLADLLYLMARLRDPDDGCPWDLQQDFKSIAKYTLEECYELIDALEGGDIPSIRSELGDLLFQVVFYTQLASEQEWFVFGDVVSDITEKLLRRHPHVFANGELHGDSAALTETAAVKQQWEEIKADERRGRGLQSVLDDVPVALPALMRAAKLQKRSARIGLDWSAVAPVLDALTEEIGELRVAMQTQSTAEVEHEIGDVLFAAVNLARHLQCDAEQALRAANRRFEARVRRVETLLSDLDRADPPDEALLDVLWQQAKRQLGDR